jgi:hypothetical protein
MLKYRTKRVAIATAGLLAGLTAATVFLCVRPAAAPVPDHGTLGSAAAAAATLALESGELFTLADRHASDALRVIAQGNAPHDSGEGLDWDYVQLRL